MKLDDPVRVTLAFEEIGDADGPTNSPDELSEVEEALAAKLDDEDESNEAEGSCRLPPSCSEAR
jgi:hypothetical protein